MHDKELYRFAPELRATPDGNTLVGYAAVFDSPTEIKGWEGHFTEVISPGAFRNTLKQRAEKIKVLFNHGQDPTIGDKPLGKPAVMREDDHGLYVEVPLDDTTYNQDLKKSLASGAIDGMSFRFSVIRDDWDDDTDTIPVRTVKEAQLYEFGPVTFPAYDTAAAGLRSYDPRLLELRNLLSDTPDPGISDETDLTPPTPAPDGREERLTEIQPYLNHPLLKGN